MYRKQKVVSSCRHFWFVAETSTCGYFSFRNHIDYGYVLNYCNPSIHFFVPASKCERSYIHELFVCAFVQISSGVHLSIYTANKENMWVLYFHPKKTTVCFGVQFQPPTPQNLLILHRPMSWSPLSKRPFIREKPDNSERLSAFFSLVFVWLDGCWREEVGMGANHWYWAWSDDCMMGN